MAQYTLGTSNVKVPRNSTMRIQDSGGTNYIEFRFNDFQFDRVKHDLAILREQGDIVGSRNGNQNPQSGSFRVYFRQFTDDRATKASVIDVLDGDGAVGSNWTKISANHERWNLDMKVTYDGTPYGGVSDGADHVITWTQVIFDWTFAQGIDGDAIDVSWQSLGGDPTVTGPT